MTDLVPFGKKTLARVGETSGRLMRWSDRQLSEFYAGGTRPFQGKWGKLINRPGVRTGLRLKMAATTAVAVVAAPVPVVASLVIGAMLRKDMPEERRKQLETEMSKLEDQVPENWHEKLGVMLENNIVMEKVLGALDVVGKGSDLYWQNAPADSEKIKDFLERPTVRTALYGGLVAAFVAAPLSTFTAVSCWQWFNKTNRDMGALPAPEAQDRNRHAPSVEIKSDAPKSEDGKERSPAP
ncbi:MAG: hypothetical protein Alpg2KO_01950 [Alphaproteobacteria bacterium]